MRLDRIFENPARKKGLKVIVYAMMVLFIVYDVFMHRHHEHFFWDSIPGFYSALGFVSCLLIIGISKGIGIVWLQKKEHYYD